LLLREEEEIEERSNVPRIMTLSGVGEEVGDTGEPVGRGKGGVEGDGVGSGNAEEVVGEVGEPTEEEGELSTGTGEGINDGRKLGFWLGLLPPATENGERTLTGVEEGDDDVTGVEVEIERGVGWAAEGDDELCGSNNGRIIEVGDAEGIHDGLSDNCVGAKDGRKEGVEDDGDDKEGNKTGSNPVGFEADEGEPVETGTGAMEDCWGVFEGEEETRAETGGNRNGSSFGVGSITSIGWFIGTVCGIVGTCEVREGDDDNDEVGTKTGKRTGRSPCVDDSVTEAVGTISAWLPLSKGEADNKFESLLVGTLASVPMIVAESTIFFKYTALLLEVKHEIFSLLQINRRNNRNTRKIRSLISIFRSSQEKSNHLNRKTIINKHNHKKIVEIGSNDIRYLGKISVNLPWFRDWLHLVLNETISRRGWGSRYVYHFINHLILKNCPYFDCAPENAKILKIEKFSNIAKSRWLSYFGELFSQLATDCQETDWFLEFGS
jgi:hypothetical protein